MNWLGSLLCLWAGGPGKRCPAETGKRSTRLHLEHLEDRTVPSAPGSEFSVQVIAQGLSTPTGITVDQHGDLFFTQLPTPGVSGANGGKNTVNELIPTRGTYASATLETGDPAPTDIVVDKRGDLFWTCHSAGVIKEMYPDGTTKVLLSGLNKPEGLALDASGEHLYFTQDPTPGVSGANGGTNSISVLNLRTGKATVLATGGSNPTDLAVDQRGNLFWTDQSAGTISERAPDGATRVVLSGLQDPEGLAIRDGVLYFTQDPTPGVPGSAGGKNSVDEYNLRTQVLNVIHAGDPAPTDITVDQYGDVFWTCSKAGVIVEAKPQLSPVAFQGHDSDFEGGQKSTDAATKGIDSFGTVSDLFDLEMTNLAITLAQHRL